MPKNYVLDACALLAFIKEETGYEIVRGLLMDAAANKISVYMNKLNLFEVFYGIRREQGLAKAEHVYNILMRLPVVIIDGIADEVFLEASRIKSSYHMSLADSIALGEASVMDASLVTSDHHEFDVVDKNEVIQFTWLR